MQNSIISTGLSGYLTPPPRLLKFCSILISLISKVLFNPLDKSLFLYLLLQITPTPAQLFSSLTA